MRLTHLQRIRWVMVIIATLPVMLVSLFFTAYMYQQRSSDGEQNLLTSGADGIKYMASNAELAVFSGNTEALEQLASQVLRLPNARYIAYVDSRRDILLDKGSVSPLSISDLFQCNTSEVFYRENLWFFCEEIVAELPVIDDFGSGQQNLTSRIGWVVLALDTAALNAYKQEALTASMSAGLLLLLLGGLLAVQFSLRLARPIHALARRVQQADIDQPRPNLGRMPVEELQVLSDAIENMLQDSVKSQELLRNQVDKATEELRKVNEDLQHRNVLLLGTQQKLEAAAKSKDMFLARVSHELRTPLTTVMGYTGLLKDISHHPMEAEYIKHISEATKSLLYIIDDILTLSKVSEGKLVVDQQLHDVAEFMQSLVSQHAFKASEKGLELIVNIDREVPKKLLVDDQRLRQVLSNFISNAIKFTEQGDISINAHVVPHSNELCFAVRDTGMGIPPDTIQKLFQPFTQADESISRRFGGSGLGLAISKQLAQLMQGRIELTSEVGKGTEAFLYLALSEDAVANVEREKIIDASILGFDPSPVVRGSWRRSMLQKVSDVLLPSTYEKMLALLDEQAVDVVMLGISGCQIEASTIVSQLDDIRQRHEGLIVVVYPVGQVNEAALEKIASHDKHFKLCQKPLLPASLSAIFSSLEATPEATRISDDVLQGVKIMLVEDQDIIRRFITLLLQNYGADVHAFASANEALQVASHHSWDIILSDLHMPDINGEDFYARLKKEMAESLPPFYIVTADNSSKEHRRLESLGVNGVIAKPIVEADFISILSRHHHSLQKQDTVSRGLLVGLIDNDEVMAELVNLSDAVATALAASDWLIVRENVHKIKGLAGVSNIPELIHVAQALSEHAKTQNLVELAKYLDQLFEYSAGKSLSQ